jgi:DNA-binding LytR/AlgR family response regulator
MKIVINESQTCEETEIVINCKAADEGILKLVSSLREYDTLPSQLAGFKDGKTYLVEPADVLYFDTVDKKTFIYTESDVLETGLRLYEIEARLKLGSFFRASKSAVINIAKIKTIVPDFGGRLEVTLLNDEKLFVSRKYATVLKAKLGL